MDYKLSTITAGMAHLVVDDSIIATIERSEGGPTPCEGQWFAYPCPSSADSMAHQHDRAARATVWGRTRSECAEEFLARR
ncbi:hypothetical protein NSA19_02980 [Actinomyces bowdenii]|uniref:hypothetical protein n=1 Tax=Actinomyces bowdenii TaxID=131109 RepID=UPI00214C04DE|nr:hypothetical protein [Actinomyces bowdenii]MCR2051833.1 hypothetical protein [Actinomyces bowdenii]